MGALYDIATWVNAHALWPNLPVWAYVLITLVDTHITTTSVTLYLHRNQTHGSISFHPAVAQAIVASSASTRSSWLTSAISPIGISIRASGLKRQTRRSSPVKGGPA